MPDAENGAWYSRDRGEIGVCQCSAEAAVLHAHFNGDSLAFCKRQAKYLGCEEAEHVTQAIMQHHDNEDQQSRLSNSTFARANDGSNDQDDTDNADQRKSGYGVADNAGRKLLQGETQR